MRLGMDEELAKYPELLTVAQNMMAAGHTVDDILEALRERSPSVIQSIKVMRDVLHIPLPEAKRLVHRSRVWSDMRDAFSEVHEIAETEYAEATSDEQDGSKQVRIDLSRSGDSEHP
jgi:ribosomal protein L7/L12